MENKVKDDRVSVERSQGGNKVDRKVLRNTKIKTMHRMEETFKIRDYEKEIFFTDI